MSLDAILAPETLLVLGFCFKAAGFLARDELWLRLLVGIGIVFDAGFFALQAVPLLPPALGNGLLVALNLAMLLMVLRERTTLAMSPREKRLFKAFGTLSPGQFRKLNRLADYRHTLRDTPIIEEGQPLTFLYFVEGFRFALQKGDQTAEAKGPAFAGEIAFLTGNAASASVVLPPGTPFVAWRRDELNRLMQRNPGLRNALVARFTVDLAGKVAQSIPMPRPARPEGKPDADADAGDQTRKKAGPGRRKTRLH